MRKGLLGGVLTRRVRKGVAMRVSMHRRLLQLIMAIALVASFVPVLPVGAIPAVQKTIYVDAVNGDDATGNGSVANPYLSIKRGLGDAEYGDTIDIAAGTYSPTTTGETFPLPITESKLILKGSDAADCIIDAEGADGIVWMMDGTELSASGLTFTHGSAADGGAFMVGLATLDLVDCVLTQNFAGRGGAIYATSATVTITNCAVTENGNVAAPIGPNSITPQVGIRGCIEGGGIYSEMSTLDIYRSTIALNSALETGGGILAALSTVTVEETDLLGNDTLASLLPQSKGSLVPAAVEPAGSLIAGVGGAVFAASSEATFTACGFWENEALLGSSIMSFDSVMNVQGCQFNGDVTKAGVIAQIDGFIGGASVGGGAITTARTAPEPFLSVEGSAFTGNSGAVIAGQTTSGIVRNCLITGNTVSSGNAIEDSVMLFLASDFDVVNTTMADNTSDGPAIFSTPFLTPQSVLPSEPEVRVTNSIIWDANAGEASVVGATVSYSDLRYLGEIAPVAFDDTVISVDPEFVDTELGHYSLSPGSPCIDTGLEFALAPVDDIDGSFRPLDGDNSSTAEWDMGAYEFGAVTDGRVGGMDRYDTAVEISQDHFAAAETVVLATGRVFADGLAASGLAGAYGAPILLTEPGTLPADVAAEILRLGASRVVICGGTGAISARVASQVAALGDIEVRRIGGRDRYETAAMIADEIALVTGSAPSLVFIARGDTFPDALAVSPIAWSAAAPILLVRPNELPRYTVDFMIDTTASTKTVIIGGEAAVSSDVKGDLVTLGVIPSDRIAGVDRYDTACAVAEWAYAAGLADYGVTGVATGEEFADALAAGPGIGASGGVLLLNPKSTANPLVCTSITDHASDILALQVFGGAAAISDEVAEELNNCRKK